MALRLFVLTVVKNKKGREGGSMSDYLCVCRHNLLTYSMLSA
jgi:hypothetical protein